MKKKPSERFREYPQRWRQTPSQVQPALTEKENVTIFMGTLSWTYYDRLIGHASASFANLVQTGERIEDGLKTGKIKDYETLFDHSPNGAGNFVKRSFPNKKTYKSDKEVHTISTPAPRYQQTCPSPAPIYQITSPALHTPPYRILYPPPLIYHLPQQ